MRIAVDATPLCGNRTGVGNYLYNILCQWEEMGIDGTVFLYTNATDFKWHLKGPRWVVRIKNFPRIRMTLPIFVPKLVRSHILPITYIGYWAMKDKADIFWAAHPKTPFYFPLKTAVTVHDFVYKMYADTMDRDNKNVYNFFADNTIHRANIIFSVSESTKKDLKKYFPFKRNIVITENAVGKHLYPVGNQGDIKAKLLEKYNLATPFILSVTTLEPRKNLEGLLQAYKILVNKTGTANKLVIVGMKGWKTDKIFTHIQELGLEDKVIFPGYVPDEDLYMFYSSASFFIFPSFYEGFGIPPLEAMACGCPVIVANRPAMPEVVGNAGLIVEPDDHQDMANKMMRLLTDKELVSDLKAKGIERVKAYSWRKTAEAAYAAMFKSVYGTRKQK